ncbi:hypothetical protein AJ88_39735 [Mesorhizobium amorphae CCBAU 01583]|nr:hypothetical protein AJ88_39735 [Mesorhizobium amorphae CCBAU 01583]
MRGGANIGIGRSRPQPLDLFFPELRIIVEQELVQLWRRYRGARKHGVHLAAVMDVVQEDVGEDVADFFRNHAVLAPVGDDAAVEIGLCQGVAEGDEPAVGRDLGGKQRLRFTNGT